MSRTTSIKLSPEERRRKLTKLRTFHEPFLEKLGVPNALFLGKSFFPRNVEIQFLNIFGSEFTKEQDMYIESVNRNLAVEHRVNYPARTLYKLKYRNDWATYYEVKESNRGFLVPVSELEVLGTLEPSPVIRKDEDEF